MNASLQRHGVDWIPASAGMTVIGSDASLSRVGHVIRPILAQIKRMAIVKKIAYRLDSINPVRCNRFIWIGLKYTHNQ